MRMTFTCIALAIAIPSAALADDVIPVLEEYNAKVRSGEIQQAVEEARANVEAFARLKEQARVRRDAASASFASGHVAREKGK